MNRKILYDLNNVSFSERESFNNAILLLSMVKSEQYYIVGFSRPKGIIEIGFDCKSNLYGEITEKLVLDFSYSDAFVSVRSDLKNIVFSNCEDIPFEHDERFNIRNGVIVYKRVFERDELIPLSIDRIDTIVSMSKNDIMKFLEKGFDYIINK